MTGRPLFHDEGDARQVARRLLSDGFEAEVVRARFAGEDDDEDQPWSVVTDAPETAVELLAEVYDGWMDYDEPASPGPVAPPLDLPSEPIRFQRPQDD